VYSSVKRWGGIEDNMDSERASAWISRAVALLRMRRNWASWCAYRRMAALRGERNQ
jgi:hypothetical protein